MVTEKIFSRIIEYHFNKHRNEIHLTSGPLRLPAVEDVILSYNRRSYVTIYKFRNIPYIVV